MQFRPFPRRTPGTLGPSNQRGALPHTPARRSRGPHAPLRSSQARRARLPLYGAYNEKKILVMRRIAVQYQFQLEHDALVSTPVPRANDLRDLTDTVARNNF